MDLRPYQSQAVRKIFSLISAIDKKNVLYYGATGAGKTAVLGAVIERYRAEFQRPVLLMAHRSELVRQASTLLARIGLAHKIIAPAKVAAQCTQTHIEQFNRSYIDIHSEIGVASVDTVIRRDIGAWGEDVGLWVVDEAHHLLSTNKWGRAVDALPNASGLGVTATPERGDGKGIGRSASGVFDEIVLGPHTQQLIDEGYLSDFRPYCPETKVDLSKVKVSRATGDFVPGALAEAVEASQIVGDVVELYQQKAPGETGIAFAVSVAESERLAAAFRAAGVPAVSLDAQSHPDYRSDALRLLASGKLKMICNAALFDEGLDIPGISVVCDAAPTQSGGRFLQRLGRLLRKAPGKEIGIYLDHADNFRRYGMRFGWPTYKRDWDIFSDKKTRAVQAETKVAICAVCGLAHPPAHRCPGCGALVVKDDTGGGAGRPSPDHVPGDLRLLTPDAFEKIRASIIDTEKTTEQYKAELWLKNCPTVAMGRNIRLFEAKKEAQTELRKQIGRWSHKVKARGVTNIFDRQKQFFETFGVDVLTAQSYKADAAVGLAARIESYVQEQMAGSGEYGKSAYRGGEAVDAPVQNQ